MWTGNETYALCIPLYIHLITNSTDTKQWLIASDHKLSLEYYSTGIEVTEGEAGALVCVQVISGLVERPQPVSVALGGVENTALGDSGMPSSHYANK